MTVAAVLAASGLALGASGRLLHIERSFFGVVRVTEDAERNAHRLFHGSTLHGQQSLDPAQRREPSTYFTRSGPIGQVFAELRPRLDQPGARVAIVIPTKDQPERLLACLASLASTVPPELAEIIILDQSSD